MGQFEYRLGNISFVKISRVFGWVSPRSVYVDASRPKLVEGFIKNTFTAMIEGVGENAVRKGLIVMQSFEQGIKDLYRTSGPDGGFS